MSTAVVNNRRQDRTISAPRPERAQPSGSNVRTLRVGLLGLGNVGQGVVRACERSRGPLRRRGVELKVVAALVRDIHRPRHDCPPGGLVTADVDAFFATQLDVVVEVLGGIEPAGSLVQAALERGIPVVSANKSLLAARGAALRDCAAQHNTTLRVEAAAIAGVPILGPLADRPVVTQADALCGIVNGTSNYIVTRMEQTGCTYEAALREAQELGYAEPDPHNDIAGVDAAEKLTILLRELGIAEIPPDRAERSGIDTLDPLTLAQARSFGGCIKPVAWARAEDDAVAAFVSPAFVSAGHPLARIAGVENAIQVESQAVGRLTYAGPGAGPDVTAATIVDDVVQIATRPAVANSTPTAPPAATVTSPSTPWLVRLDFDNATPSPGRLLAFLGSHGVWTTRTALVRTTEGKQAWFALTCARSHEQLSAALDAAGDACGCSWRAWRALEDE